MSVLALTLWQPMHTLFGRLQQVREQKTQLRCSSSLVAVSVDLFVL